MKIVIPGGSGQVGSILAREFVARGHEVVILSRGPSNGPGRQVPWDARHLGDWTSELEGADAVINLAGRSVNCRYDKTNLSEMLSSRIDSTRVVGQAIARSKRPPRLWLQMSTATIYSHRFEAANDEATGQIGGEEPGTPSYWRFSIEIARAWERELEAAKTPHTRKIALRTAMVMSPDPGGILDRLSRMTRIGLGGPIAGGRQFVSWIHDQDLVRAVFFLIKNERVIGPVNLASPDPLPQKEFMVLLRRAHRMPIGLPASRALAELGAAILRTDTELFLKSRRVIPGKLLEQGFGFRFGQWESASQDLVKRRASRTP